MGGFIGPVVLAALAATGVLTALSAVRSTSKVRVAAGAAYLVALPVALAVLWLLAATVWTDRAQPISRTTGTVDLLLTEDAVVVVDGTRTRVLAPGAADDVEVGDTVPVTITRSGIPEARADRTAAELDELIAANRQRRPPAPVDALALLVPAAAAAATFRWVGRPRS